MHTVLSGISSLQAQLKETQADKDENQKLSDLLTVQNKEIAELKDISHELEENISTLCQQVHGPFVFVYMLLIQ